MSGRLSNFSLLRSGWISLRNISLLAAPMLLMSCVATTPVKEEPVEKKEQELIVFPDPPAEPRYYFEATLISSAQVVSTEKDKVLRWKEFLTGETDKVRGEGMSKPYDVASCEGRVYVSDTVSRRVAVFDFTNKRFLEIGTKKPGALVKPFGLNTDAACNLYVADITQKKIMIYNKDGEFIRSIDTSRQSKMLTHLAATPDGSRVFAIDTGGVQTDEHHILVYDGHSGEFLNQIGSRGTEQGQFNLPKDIEIGPDGNLYLVDSGNFRVQVLNQDGSFIRSFGTIGSRPGQFTRPKGIAIDESTGIIYVVDTAFGNFQIFNQDGKLLMHIGTRGNVFAPAVYMLPAGIDVDENGRVYVVDQFFRKVDVYRPVGLPADSGAIGRKISGVSATE